MRRQQQVAARADAPSGKRAAVAMLFGALFSVQAALVVTTPILPLLAAQLAVPLAAAGQLRTVSGLAAAGAAVVLAASGRLVDGLRRQGLRPMLVAGLSLLTLSTLGSALAPGFAVLAVMQAFLGVGVALTLTAALAATKLWIPAQRRERALSWTLLGQPAAWIAGLPAMGLLGQWNWRLAWLVPAAAALVALAAVLRSGKEGTMRVFAPASAGPSAGRSALRLWAAAEMLAYAGWTAVLVYAGALFAGTYGTRAGATGILLGLAAAAYVPGNFLARRFMNRHSLGLAAAMAAAMAVTGLLLAALRWSPGFSLAVFAVFACLGGVRTLAGTGLGLGLGGADPLRAMGLRTMSVQFGYMAGAGLGGIGLAAAGWNGLGLMVAATLALSAALLRAYRKDPTAK